MWVTGQGGNVIAGLSAVQRFKGVGNVWRDPKRGLGGGWVTQAKPESGEGLAFAVSDDLRSWKLAGVQAALPECAGESSRSLSGLWPLF